MCVYAVVTSCLPQSELWQAAFYDMEVSVSTVLRGFSAPSIQSCCWRSRVLRRIGDFDTCLHGRYILGDCFKTLGK